MYINGNLEGSIKGGYTPTGGTNGSVHRNDYPGYSVGGSSTGGGSENGQTGFFDALGIWQRELADREISTLYNSGSGRQYPL
jgi:hypothetical protein